VGAGARRLRLGHAQDPASRRDSSAKTSSDKASLIEGFFTEAILEPMVAFAEEEAEAVSEPIIAEMRRGAERMLARAQEAGTFFYKLMFERNPEALQFFRTADMDAQGQHLIAAIVFLARAAGRPDRLRSDLRSLASVHQTHQIPTWAYPLLAEPLLRTLDSFGGPLTPETRRGWEVLFNRVVRVVAEPMAAQERLVEAASEFFDLIAAELHWPKARREKRWSEVMTEIRATGTYTQTFEELEFGARVAWRNAPKCIGRISWRNLVVRDMRHVTDPEAMFGECVEHLRIANNGGNLEIVMTVFRPTRPGERWGPRIWNSQLIRFAGYPQPDGSVVGDRANVALTAAIRRLGWRPPAVVSDFDVLPLVIDVPDRPPQVFELPPEEVLSVPLTHPGAPAFDALGSAMGRGSGDRELPPRDRRHRLRMSSVQRLVHGHRDRPQPLRGQPVRPRRGDSRGARSRYLVGDDALA
jgi:hemoglobin-like flavoprotein